MGRREGREGRGAEARSWRRPLGAEDWGRLLCLLPWGVVHPTLDAPEGLPFGRKAAARLSSHNGGSCVAPALCSREHPAAPWLQAPMQLDSCCLPQHIASVQLLPQRTSSMLKVEG